MVLEKDRTIYRSPDLLRITTQVASEQQLRFDHEVQLEGPAEE